MRIKQNLIVVTTLSLLIGCATVEQYSGKALLAVGGMVAKAMEGSTATVSDVTPFIKLNNVNRARPLTALEADYMAKAGIEPAASPSNATILFSRGMKLMQIEGSVKVNDQDMNYYGSGVYMLPLSMESGSALNFSIKGNAEAAVDFTEIYQGDKITLTKPEPGATLDLSKGFDIKWTPGSDSTKVVKLSMLLTQIGLENVLPVAIFNDVGKAHISPEMLGESLQPATKFKMGNSFLQFERQKDEIRYLFNGDAVVSYIDADAVEVILTGTAVKRDGPAIPAIESTEGDVTVIVSETPFKYNPLVGAVADVSKIKKIGLSSFVFKGITGGSWEKKSSKTSDNVTTTTTTTKRWGKDFGVPVLTQLANYFADGLMQAMTVGLHAEEVPKEAFASTEAYQRMASLKPESDSKSFSVNARDLADMSSWKNIKVRVGGTQAWNYDMMKASGADALAECYITATRHEPEDGKYDEFVFDVNVRVVYKAYPGPIVMPSNIPTATADYVSNSLKITPQTTYDDLLKAFKLESFMVAYAQSLNKWVSANQALES